MNYEPAVRAAAKWTAIVATVMVVLVGLAYLLASIMLFIVIFSIAFAVFVLRNDTIELANSVYQQAIRNEYSQKVLRKLYQVTGENLVQDLNNPRNRTL